MKNLKISQCMIVKDEEENIRRALSWGKGVVWEQIVVDTGSSDSTVEIAKELGAKVFYFPWRDDFSAAKNYAIEQAKGDWIVFLDADEYFEPASAWKIPEMLQQMQEKFPVGKRPDMIRATLQNLDDKGKTFMVAKQDRIFCNCKDIRYKNPIHEELYSTSGRKLISLDATKSLSIMHTGYKSAVIGEKGERNLPLLQRQVEQEPDNNAAWGYLAESLAGAGQITQARQAAEHVLDGGAKGLTQERQGELYALWLTLAGDETPDVRLTLSGKAYQYYSQFSGMGILNPDVEFAMSNYLAQVGLEEDSVRMYEQAFEKLEHWQDGASLRLTGGIQRGCNYLAVYYLKNGQTRQAVSYLTLSLRMDHNQDDALTILLGLFKEDANTTAEQVYSFLNGIYQFDDATIGLKERLFVLKAAIAKDYQELAALIRQGMSEEQQNWLHTKEKRPWMLDLKELKKHYPEILIGNRTDIDFLHLMEELACRPLQEFEKEGYGVETAVMLKEHREDFLQLYGKLGDYRSKQVFHAIMEMWLHQEERFLSYTKEPCVPYWDRDLIPVAEGLSCANIGEWIRQSTEGFLYCYGDLYGKIFCFSEKETDFSLEYRDVVVNKMDFKTLRLDHEVAEELGIIRLDVEVGLCSLLAGCERHIKEERPKLVLPIERHLNALYEIPKLLLEWNPEYQLYLRHYGQETKQQLVLFAV